MAMSIGTQLEAYCSTKAYAALHEILPEVAADEALTQQLHFTECRHAQHRLLLKICPARAVLPQNPIM